MNISILFIIVVLFAINTHLEAYEVFQDRLCSRIYPQDASSIILVFPLLHDKKYIDNETCGDLYESGITDLLQVYYLIDEINADLASGERQVSGSIGVRVCDICEDTILNTILLSENIEYITKQLKRNLIGVISGTGSNIVADLSASLNQYSLTAPILTFAATQEDLTEKYENVIQVIPDDQLQSEAIFNLIKLMSCNYITVFSDRNSYSLDLCDSIRKRVEDTLTNEEKPVCINKYVEYDSTEDSSAELDKHLQSILSLYENEINKEDPVIVYLGYTSTYLQLVNRLNATIANYPQINNIHLINSEAVVIDHEMTIDNKIKLYKISFNTFNVDEYTDLLEYYNRTLESYSNMDMPWLNEYIKKKHNCSLGGDCDLSKIERKLPNSQYLPYLIYSIVGLYEELLVATSLVCPLEPSLNTCSELYETNMLNQLLRNMHLHFEQYPLVFEAIRVSALIRNGKYLVSDESDVFRLDYNNVHNVALYKGKEWIMNDKLTDVSLKIENCICKHACYECLPKPDYVLDDGDVYFTSIVTLNKNKNNSQCLTEMFDTEYTWWMSFHEAFDTLLNERKGEFNYLSKLKIGNVMINDCDIPEFAYYNLLSLETKQKHLYDNTIAMFGSSASGITDSILRYNSKENIITVSCVSTSPALTNRTNFCRSVPDDNEQVAVMHKLMDTFNWNSAIFLYSNNNYGLNGLTAFKNVNPNVYLFERMFDANYASVVQFVEMTTQTDVVIMFANPDDIQNYFKATKEANSKTKKFYIGSDYWGVKQASLNEHSEYFLGSILIKLGVEEDSITIGQYIASKYSKMKNTDQSYYADLYFNQRFECNRENSFSNFHQPYKVCKSNFYDQIPNSMPSDPSRKDYMNAVYAVLLSYEKYLRENCASEIKEKLISCLKSARNATIIKPYLQNITLPVDFRNSFNVKLFNSVTCNGNNILYTLEQITPPIGNPQYKKYAVYDNGVLKMNTGVKKLKYYTLNGSEIDERSIRGFYRAPDVVEPVIVIPELDECEREIANFQKVIAGVAVVMALVTSGLCGSLVYFSVKLFQKKKEYNKAFKESRARETDYEILSSISSNGRANEIFDRLRRQLRRLLDKKDNLTYLTRRGNKPPQSGYTNTSSSKRTTLNGDDNQTASEQF